MSAPCTNTTIIRPLMRPLDGDFLIIFSRGRAPPGGFKFEVKVNGVIYGPPDVVSLYKIRSWVSSPPPPPEKRRKQIGHHLHFWLSGRSTSNASITINTSNATRVGINELLV